VELLSTFSSSIFNIYFILFPQKSTIQAAKRLINTLLCEGSENSETDEKIKTASHAACGERVMDIAGAEGPRRTISISVFIRYPRNQK
jgi:hypothetical protein